MEDTIKLRKQLTVMRILAVVLFVCCFMFLAFGYIQKLEADKLAKDAYEQKLLAQEAMAEAEKQHMLALENEMRAQNSALLAMQTLEECKKKTNKK